MYPKCSLSDSNIYLQIVGLLSLVIIMIIAWFYYMRVCHTTIMEKYEPVIYKEAGQLESGNRSTYPRDKYPGAQMDLIGKNTPPRSTDKYELRDCKVYFTDDTGACDGKGDNGKTCSYNFDGWQEFATYTDKNGNIIEYPRKIYKQDASNTDALINSYFTSKCFKKFDNNGDGRPKPFEYTENNLVKYDSKGSTNNTEIDTNVFAGKKYTSMQFLNNPTNPGDNFNNVLDSICSIRYNPLKDLVGKKFYKFVLKADNTIERILKVELNAEQTAFNTIKNDNGADKNALLDFSSLGSHGLKFVTNNATQLEVFISSANIRKPVNVYKFNYVSYLCPPTKMAQITNFVKTSTNINLTDFIAFGVQSVNTPATEPNPFTFPYLDKLTANRYYTANTDYKAAMIQELKDKRDERIRSLNGASNAVKDRLKTDIANKEAAILDSLKSRTDFSIADRTFSKVISLVKTDRNNSSTKIFKYYNGYNNINLSNIPLTIPANCEVIMPHNTGDICLVFKNTGDNQFTVPSRGYTCDILIVGGGGGGGASIGSGGGAGGVLYYSGVNIAAGTYTIIVGAGGAGAVNWLGRGDNGNNSSAFGNIAYGGGGGAGQSWVYNRTGTASGTLQTTSANQGSGAGGTRYKTIGNAGTAGQGYRGGNHTEGGGGIYSSGGGGGAGGIGGDGSITSSGGMGGIGVSYSITGTSIDYAGGGGGGKDDYTSGRYIYTGSSASHGGGPGGSPAGANGIDGTGGGGGAGGGESAPRGGNGGSGIVIIRIKNIIERPPDIDTNMDKNYSIDTIRNVSLVANKIQTNIITAFVFLQQGYYRFRADLGTNPNGAHPSIKYAHLMIYDETNFDTTTSKYKCVPVFRYNKQNKPAYLKQYIHIPASKFFKLAYFYLSHNISTTTIEPPFNLFYDYSIKPQTQTSTSSYLDDIISTPSVSSNTINNTDKYMIFNYTNDNTGRGQTQYTINISENCSADILMVGGGGAGGKDIGGGGGGGAVLYGTNVSIPADTYIIKVGRGATPGETRGVSTEGFGATILGGGSASDVGWHPPTTRGNGNAGGSGGGGKGVQSGYPTPTGGSVGESTRGTILASSTLYNGNNGGNGLVQGASGSKVAGGGGGGAAFSGGNANTTTGRGGNGGDGVEINIIGNSYWWGAGGGGDTEGINNTITGGNGGKGGGGAGSGSLAGIMGQTINGNVGTNGYGAASGKNAGSGTGSGGGGVRWGDTTGGNGGSGIIIIRYRMMSQAESTPITLNVLNNMNDTEDMYVSNNITNIKTSMYDYLYYGSTLYNDYKNTADPTIMNIFSSINYIENNNKNYENLATYLNNSVDYFNTEKLREEKKALEKELKAKDSELDANKTGDQELIKIDQLSNNITSINYNNRLPMTAPVLKNVPITDIFCSSNNNIYITYDTLNNTNGLNLLTHKLTPAIYIEAIT